LRTSGSSFKFVVAGRFPACGLEVLADKFGEDGGWRWGVIKQIEVSVEDRLEFARIVRAVSSEVRMVERARIVLAAAKWCGKRGYS
jgi:hypothetical protein